jgi:membrane protease subunit HflC
MRAFLAFLVVLLGLAGAGVYMSAFIVHQNEQALVVQFGNPKRVVTDPGLYWKMPFIENVEYLEKRILDVDTQAVNDTTPKPVIVSGKKQVIVDAFARYKVIDPLRFAQRLRDERNARSQLAIQLDSAMRLVLGSATLEDVVRDKREKLMEEIKRRVNDESKDLGVEIVDVRIKRADLPKDIESAIFARMKSEREQEAQQLRAQGEQTKRTIIADAERQVTIIKGEAQQKADTLRGEGEAERNRVFAEAFGRDPDFFAFYRSMQAYEHGLKAGDTRLVISPTSEFFRYFNDPAGKTEHGAPKKQ